jgi:hypothetical protein
MSRKFARRQWIIAFVVVAIISSVRSAGADDRTSFIVDMTHSLYAKVYCLGFDVTYDGFVTAAKAKNLSPSLVEQVRNGVAYLNTNGQTGQQPSKDVMDTIILAAKMIAVDQQTGGTDNWCKHRTASLLRDGFIKKVP